jgi:hypothetical protein
LVGIVTWLRVNQDRAQTVTYLNTPSVPTCRRDILTLRSDLVVEEVSTTAAISPSAATTTRKATRLLPIGRTEEVEQEAEPEATADASALVHYTSASGSRTQSLSIVPVYQGKRPSIVPVYQGKRLSASDPVLQISSGQPSRYIHIQYEM